MAERERIPVLFDTDIGSDIDDAVALAYLLRQPRCELVGVTTVSGQARERAMLADAVCRAAGRPDIPIHSGAETPFLVPQRQETALQAEVLDRFPHRDDFPPNTAVEFMRQTIRSRPGEIVLVAVGPMTNLGLLFATDPEVASMLRGLVLMCGRFVSGGPGAAEHNASCDPHATAIVYRAAVRPHVSHGLDVTCRCVLDAATCREKLRGGPLEVVRAMAEVWFRSAETMTFHDPLAAACVFEPQLCTYEDGKVEVELAGRLTTGLTRWNPASEEKPHRVATGVDPERFFAHYFSVVG